ncbi:MAG: carboxypeptidase regulatory-like domain-containing protein [Deltaproteobacteria bacterium]|nr:carboxypeptidase regulatory-like domain-containing protein [Deltaproteobacteria bacterium]
MSFAITLAACGSSKGGDDTDGGNGKPDACVGLECRVVDCGKIGQPPTTLSGTVFAPNGTLPLYGITVYVPLSDPGVPADTLECDRCSSTLPGGAVAQATSGEDGKFRLENVPVGDNIPIVITSGKWQRKITIPRVEQCVETPMVAADTSLP